MENESPPVRRSANDHERENSDSDADAESEPSTRARLRTAQLTAVDLEAQVSRLTLQLAHAREDTARARRERGEARVLLAEVRGKYEGLKRWAAKQKARAETSAETDRASEELSSPVVPFPAFSALPALLPVAVLANEPDPPGTPALASNGAGLDRDPRKRIKLDPSLVRPPRTPPVSIPSREPLLLASPPAASMTAPKFNAPAPVHLPRSAAERVPDPAPARTDAGATRKGSSSSGSVGMGHANANPNSNLNPNINSHANRASNPNGTSHANANGYARRNSTSYRPDP